MIEQDALIGVGGLLLGSGLTWWFARVNKSVSSQHDMNARLYRAEGAAGVLTTERANDRKELAELRERVAVMAQHQEDHDEEDDKRFAAIELKLRGL